MSVSVNSAPPSKIQIENGLKFVLQSDVSSWSAEKAEIVLSLSEIQGNYLDNGFSLTLLNTTFDFVFKTTPDGTAEQLSTWDVADSFAVFSANLVTELLQVQLIRQYYTITLINEELTIRAKLAGSNYTPDIDNITCGLVADVTPGSDPTLPDDYKLYFSLVKSLTASSFGYEILAAELVKPYYPDPDDYTLLQANADLMAYIKDLVKYSFTYPASGNKTLHNILSVRFDYAEYYNGIVQQIQEGNSLFLLDGGLSSEMLTKLENEGWFENSTRAKRFLTWHPGNKITAWQQPERLYWPYFGKSATLKLKVKTYTSTTDTTTVVDTFTADKQVIELFCGLHEMIPAADHETIVKYEVWLSDNSDEVISEVFTFVMDQSDYYTSRTLLFRNSWGAYEMMRFTGMRQITDKIESTDIDVLQNTIYSNFYKAELAETENNPEIVLHSGWLTGKEVRLWLEELLISRETYVIENRMAIPIVLTASQIQREADKQFSYGLQISYTKAFRNQHYSPLAAFTDRQSASAGGGDDPT